MDAMISRAANRLDTRMGRSPEVRPAFEQTGRSAATVRSARSTGLTQLACPSPPLPVSPRFRDFRAGQADTHPDYHFITVVMTDGTEYQTRSTWGSEGDKLVLDIDSSSHPAWTGDRNANLDRGGRVSRFKDKFKGFM